MRTFAGRGRVEGRATECLLGTRFGPTLGWCSGCCPWAWLSPSSAFRCWFSGCTWASPSRPTTSACASCRQTRGLTFDKQVLTSRNVSGGWFITVLMGGLNYQIEHHLFPSMPRPHLFKARRLVLAHCREHRVPYTENRLGEALAIVVRHMNDVGLTAARRFTCPTAGAMGRG
ncbi:MAG: fatty acid desaturase [Micropruina glycogenica]